jgi:hypothetical protein
VKRLILPSGLALLAVGGLSGCVPPDAQTAQAPLTFQQSPIDAGGLVGSTPDILNAEFGQPALMRVDGTAQVWIYHSSTCGLNLILYPDGSGTPRVAVAAPTADSPDPGQCTTALERAHTDAALEHPTSS